MDEINALMLIKSEDVKSLMMTDAVLEKAFSGENVKEFRKDLDALKGHVDDDGKGGLPEVFKELDEWIAASESFFGGSTERDTAVGFLKSLRKKVEEEIGAKYDAEGPSDYGFESPPTKKASDRGALIRLAFTLPVGSDDRRTVLAGLHKTAADPPPIMATVDVGDIFYSSWGYDQTNVDFYEVTGKTKTMVVIRMVEKKIVGNPDGPSVKVVPSKPLRYDTDRSRSGPFKKKVKEYRGEAYVSLSSYASAYAWNGKPQSQTGALYGH
jgi:hypothetical protein